MDHALSDSKLNCVRNLHYQLIEFGRASKVWMTFQVEYELVIFITNKQIFVQYLSAAPTRMFKRDKIIFAFRNFCIDFLQIITNSIKQVNANCIRDKSVFYLLKCFNIQFWNGEVRAFEGTGVAIAGRVLSKIP